MRAMILAAGLGTRLRPLTDDCPKALVKVGDRTLLEITLARLRSFGVNDVIINTHHFADMIAKYLEDNHYFGMHIEIARESVLLDTGGGLKQAAHFFLESSSKPEEPFLVHNVDVLSAIDLGRMVQVHKQRGALATLAVQHRKSSRYLLFDNAGELCGRQAEKETASELVRSSPQTAALAFCGVHVISPRLLSMMSEAGVFSIITTYLRLAGAGEKIQSFVADEYYWRDLGRPADLLQAAEDLQQKLIVS
jgi:NDP-sugar pyrophosphorylase family protein